MSISETVDTGGSGKVIVTGNTADNVDSHSPKYTDYMDLSLLPRTLVRGTKGMKDAGKQFLSQAPLESPASYKERLDNSVLVNAYKKTASFLAGQVFQSDVTFEEDVPEDFEKLSIRIDPLGNDINVFAKRVFQHGLEKGVAHIFVDAPDTKGEELTVKEEKERGIRPFFKEIRPEDVIGFIVDEEGALVQVRIKETVTIRVGEFGTKESSRIRVLEKGAWQLWEEQDGKDWTKIDEGKFSVNKIPLLTFIPGEEWSALTGETPLMDLAELNLRHWRSLSDQINILHVARVPILFGKNVELKVMPVGTANMVTSTDENAELGFVEIEGSAIEAGQKDLEETKSEMGMYGLQQLIPRVGAQTATEKSIASSESNSSLGTWATEFESTLNDAYSLMGEYIGQDFPEKGASVNKEFKYGFFETQEGKLLLEAKAEGVLSARLVFEEYKRRGIIDEGYSWEEIEKEIENELRTGDGNILPGQGFFQNNQGLGE